MVGGGNGPERGILRIFLDGDLRCIGVRVSPGAPRTEIKGIHGDRLKIAVCARPVKDRANRQLEEALAGWLGISSDQVAVHAGHKSRDKVVAFTGMSGGELRTRVEALLSGRNSTEEGCFSG